jgi:hypothetical protein
LLRLDCTGVVNVDPDVFARSWRYGGDHHAVRVVKTIAGSEGIHFHQDVSIEESWPGVIENGMRV